MPEEEFENPKEAEIENVRLLAATIALYLITMKVSSIILFFNASASFKGGGVKQAKTVLKWRRIIVSALVTHKIVVDAFVDRAKISFNGCKTKKIRRKKLNPATEEELKKKAARRRARRLERNKKD